MRGSLFKALADPTRRKILKLLKSGKEMSFSEIAETVDLSQPALSYHLDILKSAGLVVSRRQGKNNFYSINTTTFEDLFSMLADIFGEKLFKGGGKK